MKNTLTIIAALLLALNGTFATVRTVSNDPQGGSQYPGLREAYLAASNGDTLLVEGTNLNYSIWDGCNCCNFTPWNKGLVVIGAGLNTQKTNPAFRATYLQATFSCNGNNEWVLASGANNSKFYGISFTTNSSFYFSTGVNSITFENCYFPISVNFNNQSATNINFRNCIFGQDNGQNITLSPTGTANTVQIFNCIFD